MAVLHVSEQLLRQLESIAESQKTSVAELAEVVLEQFVAIHEPGEAGEHDLASADLKRKIYGKARRYWQQVGDEQRLALSDSELDQQFWLIDAQGVPRLKSDPFIPADDPLLHLIDEADRIMPDLREQHIAERSRDILNSEFADYLLRRLR